MIQLTSCINCNVFMDDMSSFGRTSERRHDSPNDFLCSSIKMSFHMRLKTESLARTLDNWLEGSIN